MADTTVSIGAVLDRGFRLFREHWRALVPAGLVAALLGQFGGALQFAVNPGPDGPAGFSPGIILLGLASVFGSLVGYALLIVAIDDRARSRERPMGALLGAVVQRLGALLGVTVLIGLGVLAGFVLLVVPGIYLSVAWSQAYYPVLLDGARPVAALGVSRALVRGSWWRTATLLFVAGLISALAVSVPAGLIGGIAGALGLVSGRLDAGAVALLLVVALVTGPLMPLGTALVYAVYRHLREGSDGDDLRARLEAADS